MEDDAAVSGHGVQQAAGAGDAGVGAVDEAHGEHEAEDCRGGAVLGRAEDDFYNGHAGCRSEDGLWVVEAEEDGEDEQGASERRSGVSSGDLREGRGRGSAEFF